VKKEPIPETKKPHLIKYGINHVTALVESNQAKLVVIAHDVDPIEIVMWLPSLCRAKNVPYVIAKGKAQLGALVHKKTAAALAITSVAEGDSADLAKLTSYATESFNNAWGNIRTQWGGKKLGNKSMERIKKLERSKAAF